MQKHRWYLLYLITMMLVCFGSGIGYAAGQSSPNYTMERYSLNGAGGDGSSNSYYLSHTLGQSSPIRASPDNKPALGSLAVRGYHIGLGKAADHRILVQ